MSDSKQNFYEMFKNHVRSMAEIVNQLDQHLSLVKNPDNQTKFQEMLKVKENIIGNLSKELKLPSIKLLKTYEKISSKSKLLLNDLNQENENIIELTNGLKQLTKFYNEFQQKLNNALAKNIKYDEVEQEISREFEECKSDMNTLLSLVDPSSTLKELLCLLMENNDEDDNKDTWVDIEDKPHLFLQCEKLKKDGFIIQNQRNKYLFKLNF